MNSLGLVADTTVTCVSGKAWVGAGVGWQARGTANATSVTLDGLITFTKVSAINDSVRGLVGGRELTLPVTLTHSAMWTGIPNCIGNDPAATCDRLQEFQEIREPARYGGFGGWTLEFGGFPVLTHFTL